MWLITHLLQALQVVLPLCDIVPKSCSIEVLLRLIFTSGKSREAAYSCAFLLSGLKGSPQQSLLLSRWLFDGCVTEIQKKIATLFDSLDDFGFFAAHKTGNENTSGA